MSLASVRAFFAERAPDIAVIELDVSTATVAEAAAAHGVEPGQIAKTLSLQAAPSFWSRRAMRGWTTPRPRRPSAAR